MLGAGRKQGKGLAAGIACACYVLSGTWVLGMTWGRAEKIPAGTAIPVVLTGTLEAGRARAGDRVTAKTMQSVLLPDGRVIEPGALVMGHVAVSNEFRFDGSPYAAQKASVLAIHFDTITVGGTQIAVSLQARAVAGAVASHGAEIPTYRDEKDTTGRQVLIGGAERWPLESAVLSRSGAVEGYSRKEGVFARLRASANISSESAAVCEGTEGEQSAGIFSADACGAYGLHGIVLTENGGSEGGREPGIEPGTFLLESRTQSVALHAGSTALLQAR